MLHEDWLSMDLRDSSKTPRTFLVNFVAYVVFYWHLSPDLMSHTRPDQDFAWQMAVQAMHTDIQKGDIYAMLSAIFNVAGRPSRGFVSNMTAVSRIVALAHSCGLNHDSQKWSVSVQEKQLRWRMWWAVLVHDRWLNFAQGTPPAINQAHYDVPLPTIQLLAGSRPIDERHRRAAECYVELCKLTEILGDVLPLIFHVRAGHDGAAAEQISRSEIELDRWHTSRPKWIDYAEFEHRLDVPGLVNLQLSFLSVRMLLRRIAWYETAQKESDLSSAWLHGCLEAAEKIVQFTCTLRPSDLAGFWLPYNAHHFNSAAALLMRCAVQTHNVGVRKRSITNARKLVDCLRRFKDEHGWDMAGTALAQCETDLKRIEHALSKASTKQQQTFHQYDTSTPHIDDTFWENPMLQFQGFGCQGESEDFFQSMFSEFTADSNIFEPFAELQQYR